VQGQDSDLAQSVPLLGQDAVDSTNEGICRRSYCTKPALLKNNLENTNNIDTKGNLSSVEGKTRMK